ncbi:calcium-binding protein [uncultured Roseobacter sp.]|uniref:calcium-binding protein n=1 Tax=uncultured Roseobacter sp. TaxID=114847 RepID=UPI0026387D63|nr:calcium-binding protein [uncultured Roseobacter sp.]
MDGNGIEITELSKSTIFMDAGGDGLLHRTAWAGAGDGVLFIDDDGDGAISEKREFVFTEWDPTATDDLAALRAVFDSSDDGVLDASDDRFADFKVLVTNPDGSTTAKTLTELGITSIDLTADTTRIELPDGSMITGETTFTRADGTTGKVANATLVAEAQGYRVEQSEGIDGAGNRVVVNTAFSATGDIAYVITSVTSPDGAQITNSYDDNGDGVVDRLQKITTLTDNNGNKTETTSSSIGSDPATAILVSRVVTTTSADGSDVTIQRDSTGGGWFDQEEIRTTAPDGSRSIVINDLAQDGSVIRGSSETTSVNGLIRTKGTDEDGDTVADATVSHSITEHADASRTESTDTRNQDGSLRSSEVMVVGPDGESKVIRRDADGDGLAETVEDLAITLNAGGDSTSLLRVENGDGSLRSETTQTQSADALTKTIASDVDGDGDIDSTTVDATVIHGDGSRENTVTVTNTDGSVRSMQKKTLGADKVSSETWVDLDQDGVFDADERIRSVTIDTVTEERTTLDQTRALDGTVLASTTTLSSKNGLTITTSVDADGDGDVDTIVSDTTAMNGAGVSMQTVETRNQNGTLRDRTVEITSTDGLTTTTTADLDGDGVLDSQTLDVRVLEADGGVTRTVSAYAGDGTTLLNRTTSTESADRRIKTTDLDTDGDGIIDERTTSTEAVDGATVVSGVRSSADGTKISASLTSVSANGLVSRTERDLDGDDVADVIEETATVLNADGSRTTTTTVLNGDLSLRGTTISTVSDDTLTARAQRDADGDGVFERDQTSTSLLNADGTWVTADETRAADGRLLTSIATAVSDDGLTTRMRYDSDGDGIADLESEATTVLHDDGGRTVTRDLREAGGGLRDSTRTTRNDNDSSVLVEADVNGDGVVDMITSRVLAESGILTETVTELSAMGDLQSRSETVTSANGLTVTSRLDEDGDGVFERTSQATSVLDADGSRTTTIVETGADGSRFAGSAVTVSDDGTTTTELVDADGNGADERTTTSSLSWSLDGIWTETVQATAENGDPLNSRSSVTSADGRTVTTSLDADGNGFDDEIVTTSLGDDGAVTTETTYHSTGGALIAKQSSLLSANGLTRLTTLDRDGDGTFELRSMDRTTLKQDGATHRVVEHRDGHYVALGREEYLTSDDGLSVTAHLDLDGDGVEEAFTTDVTELRSDGGAVRAQLSRDATATLMSEITTTTSGNGLETFVVADYDGDGRADRHVSRIESGTGAVKQTTQDFGAGYTLTRAIAETITGDGRARTQTIDLDGNGFEDRRVQFNEDLSRGLTSVHSDLKMDGSISAEVKTTQSANGMARAQHFDFDGDGSADRSRTWDTTFADDGSVVVSFAERFGQSSVAMRETVTTSANGYRTVTETDMDGDGVIDGTKTTLTTYGADGSTTTTAVTRYADDELRSNVTITTSADGRTSSEIADYDGNGIADKQISRSLRSDGQEVVIERSFNEGGSETNRFVTTTSSDGLVTTFLRDGNLQTITRSVVDPRSYVWDNGVTASVSGERIVVSHEFDTFGIETWTSEKSYYSSSGVLLRETAEARLDQSAMNRVLDEAARIFDTVLDRDMDFNEIETLVEWVEDAELKLEDLASELLSSYEFSTRYGTQSNAEFLTQIYLNSFGRAPDLQELHRDLDALATSALSKTDLALRLSESIEHLIIGNEHRSTNNFDVIINPAEFERTLDRAYVESLVKSLIDVTYDRDATAQELAHFSDLLLEDTDKLDDIAVKLLAADANIQGVASTSLAGLTGTALVQQAFLNALGRAPDPSELATWEQNLSSGRLSAAQFIASLAQSPDHLAIGRAHVANTSETITVSTGSAAVNVLTGGAGQDDLRGFDGNDTLTGGAGSDRLTGGAGNDYLNGSSGNDIYVWSRGHGSDTIYDGATSLSDTDSLVLTDLTSGDVTLTRPNDSSYGMVLAVKGSNEVLTFQQQYYFYDTRGYGIEMIEFSDGEVWTKERIEAETKTEGTNGNQGHIVNTFADDALYGLGGNDTFGGGKGDDRLVGGLGDDRMNGGEGSDSYVWTTLDGNDTINDTATSLTDVDMLVLTDVNHDDVTLIRPNDNSYDLQLTIDTTGEVLTFFDQYYFYETRGYGIEMISFADGITWAKDDIERNSTTFGTDGVEGAIVNSFAHDAIYALGGNDIFGGGRGDDTLVGGLGDDRMNGGEGNDTYIWSTGDGNDTIHDTATSMTDVDKLVLKDVDSTDVELTRPNDSSYGMRLTVGATGEVITFTQQYLFYDSRGYGIEMIEFADGVTWVKDEIEARTRTYGTDGNQGAIINTFADDNIYGLDGNDVFGGGKGDDRLVGGLGADRMNGGEGNDVYIWSRGDGNDTINDTSTSLSEVDVLKLENVDVKDADLSQVGSNLVITIVPTGESLTDTNRFQSATLGYGLEVLAFADGSLVEVLNQPVAETVITGTSASNTLVGWGFKDRIFGLEGNDTLDGKGGDDRLEGGEGVDLLKGGGGNDRYIWTTGDGSDTIDDSATSLSDIDTLVLTDVSSTEVTLTRPNDATFNLLITMDGSPEVLTIKKHFAYYDTRGTGIEAIEFSDGVIWTKDEIEAKTKIYGTAANDTSIQISWADDHIYGLAGNDTLRGDKGDDHLFGGEGVDHLDGGVGNDRYVWTPGDGNDTIHDTATSLSEVDRLVLKNVTSEDVTLTRPNDATFALQVRVDTTGEMITVHRHFAFYDTEGVGIEAIEFSDGVIWTKDEIEAKTKIYGTAANDTSIQISWADDHIYGLAGNDTLRGDKGDDHLFGGEGVDHLDGGVGNDRYVWTPGDGNDTIHDTARSLSEVDRLVLKNVTSEDVTLTRPNDATFALQVRVDTTGEMITVHRHFAFYDTEGVGIEAIEFSDGVIWTKDEIEAKTTISLTSGNDGSFFYSFAGDNVYGLDGNDTLKTHEGDDTLVGGLGADHLDGQDGIDTASYHLSGQGVIVDLDISGGQIGANGGEEVGDVLVNIEALEGSLFDDQLTAGSAGSILRGLSGDDDLTGGAGADQMDGGEGSDTLVGNDGFDTLVGGAADDSLFGGAGNDLLTGGIGADVFIFELKDGSDTITDFEDGIDQIRLSGTGLSFTDLTIIGQSGDAMISFGTDNVIVVTNIDHTILTEADFQFV